MAATGDDADDEAMPTLVRDLPGGTRVLIDLDEERDVAHVARGERLTATLCDHDLSGERARQAHRDRVSPRRACPDCVTLIRRDR